MSIHDILNRLEEAERRFAGTEFLAPIMGEARVHVRIAGVVCKLKVAVGLPPGFAGYAFLRARSTREAEFVRAATLQEITQYLALFPTVRLILTGRERRHWWALPAQLGDIRIHLSGPVVVQLPEEGLDRFETILTRFDGRLFWYERRDPARNPALAAYLREQLTHVDTKGMPPEPGVLHASGLSREEREAYAWVRGLAAAAQRDRIETRLSDAVAHAGADFRGYTERGDAYVVTFQVDGRQFTSTVRQDDLTVITAGICLSGKDQRFDLASLVGVLRQADTEGRLAWMDDGESD